MSFKYLNWDFLHENDNLTLSFFFNLNGKDFEEKITFPQVSNFELNDNIRAAAKLLHLILGVSYYKAEVPDEIICNDLPDLQTAQF